MRRKTRPRTNPEFPISASISAEPVDIDGIAAIVFSENTSSPYFFLRAILILLIALILSLLTVPISTGKSSCNSSFFALATTNPNYDYSYSLYQ
jgi:hypothetical protein